MKKYSLSIFLDFYPSISCCMSATRLEQWLGLGLGLGQGLGLVLGVRVRARTGHCHLLTLLNFGTIYTERPFIY